jgi:hypothetical protein
MVGMQGFEPWTSRSRSVRATKLRYIPTLYFVRAVRSLAATKCIIPRSLQTYQSHLYLKSKQNPSIMKNILSDLLHTPPDIKKRLTP